MSSKEKAESSSAYSSHGWKTTGKILEAVPDTQRKEIEKLCYNWLCTVVSMWELWKKYEFITFDRVNHKSIIWSQPNAKNVLLESWLGPEWVLTGKLALWLSIRRCRWLWIYIFKKGLGFLWENMYRVRFQDNLKATWCSTKAAHLYIRQYGRCSDSTTPI